MNYQKIYFNIIDKAKSRNWSKKTAAEYVERHHILPRSLGGLDQTSNLVYLTAKEHFICHWLLYKLSTGLDKAKMANAWFKMCQKNDFQNRYNSRNYALARKAFSENNPFKSFKVKEIVKRRMTVNNPMKDPIVAKKVSQSLKGKQSGSNNGFYGKHHSDKTLEKISGKNHYTQRVDYIPREISDDQKQKISSANKGRRRPDLIKRNLENSSTWKIITPDGDEFIIKNLNNWAKENKINPSWLYQSKNGFTVVKL